VRLAGNRTSVKVSSAGPVTTTYDVPVFPPLPPPADTDAHDAIGELTQIDKAGGTTSDWNFGHDS
jgi:hypothetical protein